MIDLINRKAALEAVNAYDYRGMTVEQVKTITDGCAEELRKLPAIDAEPVRRGHWIKCNGKSHIWYCSECGDRINYNQARRTYKPDARPVSAVNKYCRCCGTKMGGDG